MKETLDPTAFLTAFAQEAAQKDANDPLASFRHQFVFPRNKAGKEKTYLAGNSKGLAFQEAVTAVEDVMQKWAEFGVEAYFDATPSFVDFTHTLKPGLMSLVGAEHADEVACMHTDSVNMLLLLSTFYQPRGPKVKVLRLAHTFPSDRYVLASVLRQKGYSPEEHIITLSPQNGDVFTTQEILEAIETHARSLALIVMDGVNYYTGQFLNIPAITAAAVPYHIPVGFDLAHGIGNVPLELHNWDVDFATWCSYKYLNGGPGAPGGMFIHRKHHGKIGPAFQGWWGHKRQKRFDFSHTSTFEAHLGADGFQLSNAPIIQAAIVKASLDIFQKAGMPLLRKKSVDMSAFALRLLETFCPNVELISPQKPHQRGAQLSLRVPGGKEVFKTLTQSDIVCDWRAPDCIRIAPTPLYNTYADILRFVEVLSYALSK